MDVKVGSWLSDLQGSRNRWKDPRLQVESLRGVDGGSI